MKKIGKIAQMTLVILLIAPAVAFALRYLDFRVHGILTGKGEILDSLLYRTGFYLHVILGLVALLSGPLQFSPGMRSKKPGYHRMAGKVYVAAFLISGLAGLCIAQFATGGWITRLGFSGLAIAWLYTTSRAYFHIRRRQIDLHKRWMFRSYALTFAAATLRIYLGIMIAGGVAFLVAYQIVSWACWVPNLIAVEWIWVRKMSVD